MLARWVVLPLMASLALTPAQAKDSNDMPDKQWSLAIHGGAGMITRDRLDEQQLAEIEAGLGLALGVGGKTLADGGSAVDAVQAQIFSHANRAARRRRRTGSSSPNAARSSRRCWRAAARSTST